jgi:hypothetical protein
MARDRGPAGGRARLAEVARVAVPKGRDRVTSPLPLGRRLLQAGCVSLSRRATRGNPLARTEADGELVRPRSRSRSCLGNATARRRRRGEAIHWLNRDLAAKAATLLLRPQDTERGHTAISSCSPR